MVLRIGASAAVALGIGLMSFVLWPRRLGQLSVFILAAALAVGLAVGILLGLPGQAAFFEFSALISMRDWQAGPYEPIIASAPTGLGALALLAALTAMYAARFKTAMGLFPVPLQEFVGSSDRQRLRNLVSQLRDDLDALDRQTDWRAAEYVPLEAEVEVYREGRRKVQVADLYSGLRRNIDCQLFVILGDPGSGKSVALRKLARDLLGEVFETGRIPIYINLKEWRPTEAWRPGNGPTRQQLVDFILGSVRGRLGLTSSATDFLERNFLTLLASGRLFLILDSFDEIPQLLDATDASWLIQTLSLVTAQLITDSADGRGIISSRLFRKPDISRNEYCRLDIRALSDEKISQLIDQQAGSSADANTIKKAVFADRSDLAAVARNPLLLTLLVEYLNRNNGQLPPRQSDMFRSHMDHNIAVALTYPDYRDLDAATIWRLTEQIAEIMFNEANFGLEMPTDLLSGRLPNANVPISRVLGFLVHAKLGRFGQHGQAFSFVHRRFNEFFLAQWLLKDRERVSERLESITDDGRWRDALVLYAEVASDEQAGLLVEYCMDQAGGLLRFECRPGDSNYAKGLHSLRFMVDAFRGRPNFLLPFQERLSRFVHAAMDAENDILVRKNAVEAIGLLPTPDADRMVGQALSHSDSWSRETAFRACRYLPSVTKDTLMQVRSYFLSMPASSVLRLYRQTWTVFLLAEPFKIFKKTLFLRAIEAVISLILPFWIFFLGSFEPSFLILIIIGNYLLAASIAGSGLRLSFANLKGNPFQKLLVNIGADENVLSLFTFKSTFLLSLLPSVMWPLVMPFILVLSYISPSIFRANKSPFDIDPMILIISIIVSLPYASIVSIPYLYIDDKIISIINLFLKKEGWFRLLKIIMVILFGIATTDVVAIAVTWLMTYVRPLLYLMEVIVGVGVGIGFCFLTLEVFRALWPLFRDWWRIRLMGPALPLNRKQIADNLCQLSTNRGRAAYIRWLSSRVSDLDRNLRVPDDRWPDGMRPNYGDDEASTMLAQLDERWLSLSR